MNACCYLKSESTDLPALLRFLSQLAPVRAGAFLFGETPNVRRLRNQKGIARNFRKVRPDLEAASKRAPAGKPPLPKESRLGFCLDRQVFVKACTPRCLCSPRTGKDAAGGARGGDGRQLKLGLTHS